MGIGTVADPAARRADQAALRAWWPDV